MTSVQTRYLFEPHLFGCTRRLCGIHTIVPWTYEVTLRPFHMDSSLYVIFRVMRRTISIAPLRCTLSIPRLCPPIHEKYKILPTRGAVGRISQGYSQKACYGHAPSFPPAVLGVGSGCAISFI